ncbi:flagellar hook-associated protein FlgL [Spongiibacter sp. KMU-158]|uniref:Flagellar hook-associated protein FlgL n=1 Tax=Spongiibacter pelagi TaxID=2760804 RepID=A0A927GV90_9GAMM|nr:flagellar hook-associated protein FlgL [Spongiibacter pelagi]MBD2858421.1 flagellar hook-associated protein FlgL [Spongiibacter pelagi]
MRIASSQIYGASIRSMMDQQSQLSKTQAQLATGNRIQNPADDPIGAVRVQGLGRSLERTEQYSSNSNILDSRLRLEEETVGNSIEILQRVRDMAIQANNPVHSEESKGALLVQLKQEIDSLLAYANTQDNDGRYIFSGYQNAAPFSYDSNGINYNGDDGQRQLLIGPARTLGDSDPGSKVFMGILDGNGRFATEPDAANTGDAYIALGEVVDNAAFTGGDFSIEFIDSENYRLLDAGGAVVETGVYKAGSEFTVAGMSVSISGTPAAGDQFHLRAAQATDVFSILDNLADAFEIAIDQPSARGQRTSAINNSISNIDQAIDHLINTQSKVGARMVALETQTDINAGANIRIQENLSEIKDLDYAEAISRFNQQMAGLEAAQSVFGKLQNLSLFNYL